MTFLIWVLGVGLMVIWLAGRSGVITWWHYLIAFIFSGIWLLISMVISVLIGFIKTKAVMRELENSQKMEIDKPEQKNDIGGSFEDIKKIQCLVNTNDFLSDLFGNRIEIPIESLDDMNNILLKMILTLTPREENVLRLKYGLFDIKKLTTKDIAEKFGVSQETIRRYEKKGMIKMRHPSRLNRIEMLLSQLRIH